LDYFSQMLFLKTLQKICIGCLEVGVCKCFWIHLEKNTDHADAAALALLKSISKLKSNAKAAAAAARER